MKTKRDEGDTIREFCLKDDSEPAKKPNWDSKRILISDTGNFIYFQSFDGIDKYINVRVTNEEFIKAIDWITRKD